VLSAYSVKEDNMKLVYSLSLDPCSHRHSGRAAGTAPGRSDTAMRAPRRMNAMNHDQASQPLSAPLVISAVWWAFIVNAVLSAVVR
jgi:hypothetical protein